LQAAKGAADAAIRLRFCSRRAAETAASGCKAAPYGRRNCDLPPPFATQWRAAAGAAATLSVAACF